MPKKILILNGSPRSNGNSATLAENLAEGARQVGASVESLYLHGMDIRPCEACDECRDTNGICIIKDDMQSVSAKIAAADAIVLASPIYWFTYSAQLKLCIDRWYAFGANRYCDLHGKQFAILLAYGDSDAVTSGAVNAIHSFEDMCHFLKADLVGVVHGSLSDIGDVQKHPELLERAHQLGRELAGSRQEMQ